MGLVPRIAGLGIGSAGTRFIGTIFLSPTAPPIPGQGPSSK